MTFKEDKPLIVVFGGAGYIGSSLIRQLLQAEYRVRIFDNFSFGRMGLDGLSSPCLEVVYGDITDCKQVSHAIEGAEAVILLAAIIGHRRREISRLNLRETNLLGSSVVVDAAKEHGVSRFIFASSDSVYGEQRGVMYETGTPDPISIFSRLKLRMEERVLRSQSRQFIPTVFRICNCHGYSPRMRFDLFPNFLVRDAVLKKGFAIQGGDQCRAFINVDDAARAFVVCLKAYPDTVSGEIFNVGDSSQNLQFNLVVNTVLGIIPDCSVKFIEKKPDLVDYKVSFSKLENLLKFKPALTLTESLTILRDKIAAGAITDPYSSLYSNTESS